MMITWKNLDTVDAYQELTKVEPVNLKEVMSGESGAERVKNYSVPMAEGLAYNFAAKQVDDKVLAAPSLQRRLSLQRNSRRFIMAK